MRGRPARSARDAAARRPRAGPRKQLAHTSRFTRLPRPRLKAFDADVIGIDVPHHVGGAGLDQAALTRLPQAVEQRHDAQPGSAPRCGLPSARPEAVDYSDDRFRGTYTGLERILVMPWNEKYTDEHVDYIADAISRAVDSLAR